MSDIPGDLRFSKSHEWVRQEDDGTVTVGITDHAQELLGDLVFVELPEVGRTLAAGDEMAVVESVKAASDVYCPLDGEITASNDAIVDDPSIVNSDPMGAGWFFKIKLANPSAADGLMDEAAYKAMIG